MISKVSIKAPVLKVPKFFHDILGEEVSKVHIFWIVLGTAITSYMLMDFGMNQIFSSGLGLANGLAFLLIVDIIAGAIANLTLGTNHFYATRPVNRLIFIGVHFQPILIHALIYRNYNYQLIGEQAYLAIGIWLYVLFTSLFLNMYNSGQMGLSYRKTHQTLIAGTVFLLGLVFIIKTGIDLPEWLKLVYIFFVFKVVFSFTVNHYENSENEVAFEKVVTLLGDSFANDPLMRLTNTAGWSPKHFVHMLALKTYVTKNQLYGYINEEKELMAIMSFSEENAGTKSHMDLGLVFLVAEILNRVLSFRMPLKGLKVMNDYMIKNEALKPDEAHVYVHFIAVSEGLRGKGLGKRLLMEAEHYALSKSIYLLALDTENETNVKLYEHLGYEEVGREKLRGIEVVGLKKMLTQ